jgi:hypothetical protein
MRSWVILSTRGVLGAGEDRREALEGARGLFTTRILPQLSRLFDTAA